MSVRSPPYFQKNFLNGRVFFRVLTAFFPLNIPEVPAIKQVVVGFVVFFFLICVKLLTAMVTL